MNKEAIVLYMFSSFSELRVVGSMDNFGVIDLILFFSSSFSLVLIVKEWPCHAPDSLLI
jgi:hypothetical protein